MQALDTDKSGTVTLEELKEGLAKQGSEVTQRELQALVESMDFDANGSIDYDEFCAATINMSQLQVLPQCSLSTLLCCTDLIFCSSVKLRLACNKAWQWGWW